MTGVLRVDTDPGLLTNRRMSLEVAVGLAELSGRRLSMQWSDRIGPAPGPRPAHRSSGVPGEPERPTMPDLWEIPVPVVADAEWRERLQHAPTRTCEWGPFTECVYLADPEPIPHPGVIDFANGRTRFVRVPETDDVVHVAGRPLAFFSYFFHATGATRRRLLAAIAGVRPLAPYRALGAAIAADLGSYNLVHLRRTDHVKGIRAYAGVSPARITANLAALLPTDQPILIATEADPRSALFDPLRTQFREVVFVSDVILGDHREAFGSLPWSEDNALGIVTQEVAIAAQAFVGTAGSTFSALIQRERCRRDPDEPFRYTADFTPDGPVFRDGEFVEAHPGRYTWNRVRLNLPPDTLSWFREWPEAVRSPDDEARPSTDGPEPRAAALHAVICTDTNPYGDWQCRLLEHTWVQAGQPGELVRLVGCPNGEEAPKHARARVVATESRNSHPRAPGEYPGFNRLWSLREWLDLERPRGSILILDSDMVFRTPVRYAARPGELVVQEWYGSADGTALADLLAPFTSVDRDRIAPLTWPMVADAADLASLLPRWIELCADLREATGMWESDMVALVGSVAESDLEVRYETLAAWMNWPEDFVAGAPIIHYCQPVLDRAGERLWYKQGYTPWEPLGVDPDEAALDYCRDLLHLVDDFITTRQPR